MGLSTVAESPSSAELIAGSFCNTTIDVPAASTSAAAAAVVFTFVHAISFRVPWLRVRSEHDAPFKPAEAATAEASPTGAALTELTDNSPASAAADTPTPRRTR